MSKIELCPEWNLMCICRKGVRKKGRKGGRKERSKEERTERQMAITCKNKNAFRTGYMPDSIKNNVYDANFILIKVHSPFKNRRE